MAVSGKVTLVRAKKEDAQRLADISKRAFHTDMDVGAPGEEAGGPVGYDSPEFQANLMRLSKEFDYHKILYNGQIVGGLIVAKRRPGHYECARIFVDPEFQNQGAATRAFELAWDIYKDAKVWTTGTPEWNVRTKHFYEKLGFVQVGWTRDNPEWRGRFYEKVMDSDKPYELMKIKDLREGMRGIEVEANVLEKSEPRQVRSKRTGESYMIAEAIIGDETGTLKLVLWNEQIKQVNIHDKIRIENGYVTSYRGEKQLNIGRYGTLVILV